MNPRKQQQRYSTLLLVSILSLAVARAVHAGDISGFVADSSLEATFRTFYFDRDYREERELAIHFSGTDSGSRRAATQSLLLDFESGYWLDRFGADVSYYGTLKLDGGAGTGLSGLTLTKDDGSQHSFQALGVALLKARFAEGNTELKVGRQTFDTPLINSSDSRSQPATQQGAAIYVRPLESLDLYGIYINKYKPMDNKDFEDLRATYGFAGGGEIDDIYSLGLNYRFDSGLALTAQWTHSSDTWNSYWLESVYDFDFAGDWNLELDGIYYHQKDTGDFSQNTGNRIDNDLFNLRALLSIHEHLRLSASYQVVSGSSGADYYAGTDPYWWNSVQYSDFNFADESSWQIRLDYDFAALGLPGLSFMTRYTFSDDAKTFDGSSDETFEENEWDAELNYQVQQGPLKDLSARLRFARYRSDVGLDNGGDLNDFRFIINYRKEFF